MLSEQFSHSDSECYDAICESKIETRSTTIVQKAVEPERTANFYYWKEHFPELKLLQDDIDIIIEESKNIENWVPWPEDHFSLSIDASNRKDWTVFPLMYTFPAFDDSRKTWVNSTSQMCPRTTALIKQIPNSRTALFSKLGPTTTLASHTGWADLSNYVLRCHLCLDIPNEDNSCGLLVSGDVQYHKQNQIIVFDDSKSHRAFNNSDGLSRTVLIIDMARPPTIPLGTATGSHTAELDGFVSMFK